MNRDFPRVFAFPNLWHTLRNIRGGDCERSTPLEKGKGIDMKMLKIESLMTKAQAAYAYAYADASSFYIVSDFLFWSVFGPFDRYNYRKPISA